MDTIDCVVAGAGVVGMATARALALQGREVIVLDAAAAMGTGTTARNSEVIHAGIYYPRGSLKARLCVQGKALLYDYCEKHHVPHKRCGKLIVATTAAQLPQLQTIQARAQANGVSDLQILSSEEARALEPLLHCTGALLSPGTGIIDVHTLMLHLLGDLEAAGGAMALNTPLERAQACPGGFLIRTGDGTELLVRELVNAAGLSAQKLALHIQGLAQQHIPPNWYAKGNYFTLSGKQPFARLVYPVPESGGLGVHLTIDLGGQTRFGPDVQWVDSADDLLVEPSRGDSFYARIRRFWPGLPDGALAAGYAGIRPKITGPGAPDADFLIQGPQMHGVPGLVNLFGIESPGLTSSLAIGAYVAALLRR